jgi:hypothetical protein
VNVRNTQRHPVFQFSLWRALVLLAFVGVLTAALVNAWKLRQATHQIAAASTEIRSLRNELGYLTIDDRDRIQVRQIKTLDRLTWKWRIFLPAGYSPAFSYSLDGIKREGLPERQSCWFETPFGIETGPSLNLTTPGKSLAQPTEFTFTVAIRDDPRTGWMLLQEGFPDGQSMGSPITEAAAWIEDNPGLSTAITGGPDTASFGIDDPIPLLRLRVHRERDDGSSYLFVDDPVNGLILWVENRLGGADE